MNIPPEPNATKENAIMENDETSANDPVIAHILSQIDSAARAPKASLLVGGDESEVEDGAEEDETNGQSVPSRKGLADAKLKQVIGGRLIKAREMNGMLQGEVAKALGFSNGTQLNLWEQGKRLPPLYSISLISEVLSVSTDWLLGLDTEPERDSATATRNAVVRRMAGLLENNARSVAEVLLESAQFDPSSELRSTKICSLVVGLCDAVDRYRAVNVEAFEDTRCSALLMRAASDARSAIEKVSRALDRADFRCEQALKKSQAALVAYQ